MKKFTSIKSILRDCSFLIRERKKEGKKGSEGKKKKCWRKENIEWERVGERKVEIERWIEKGKKERREERMRRRKKKEKGKRKNWKMEKKKEGIQERRKEKMKEEEKMEWRKNKERVGGRKEEKRKNESKEGRCLINMIIEKKNIQIQTNLELIVHCNYFTNTLDQSTNSNSP